jgi:DNA repair protein RecO (recombination protein O)
MDSGESDRRLILLTEEHGKIDAIAKGARKGGSRLAGISEPLTLSRFTLAVGRQRRFVTQAQPLTSYPRIRGDYERLMAAMAWFELLDLSLPYEGPEAAYWELAVKALRAWEDGEKWLPTLAWILSATLEAEGHHPSWLDCQDSGERPLEDVCWVSPHAGGRISAELRHLYGDSFPVSPHALIALSRLPLLEEPPAHLKNGEEVARVLLEMWQGVLDRPLKAGRSLMEALQASGP